jgi:hypothetical protein
MLLLLLLITGMDGDLFMAPLVGLDGVTPRVCEGAAVLLNPGGCTFSLELLGVRRGDLTVTCFAPAACAEVGVVGATIGIAVDATGVVGGVMIEVGVVEPLGGGGDTSTLRLGDLPI